MGFSRGRNNEGNLTDLLFTECVLTAWKLKNFITWNSSRKKNWSNNLDIIMLT
jgi:hypothetical protein